MPIIAVYVDDVRHSVRHMHTEAEAEADYRMAVSNMQCLSAVYNEMAGLITTLGAGTVRRYKGWECVALRSADDMEDLEENHGDLVFSYDNPDHVTSEETVEEEEPDADQITREDIDSMNKAQCVEVLKAHGVRDEDIDKKAKVADLRAQTKEVVFSDV